ncbi:MAG: prolipoprotein diacylglyceryl transferase [Flavobacteriaceae bacterium]|nr:prolipoprotein diacylglyceryl transferase [Flavobacteriaceae bacterium]
MFGVLSLRYYSFLFALGLVLAYITLKGIFTNEKISTEKLEPLFIYVVIGTVLGARLGHCLFYEPEYYLSHIAEFFLPVRKTNEEWEITGFQGLSSHGGAIGVLIAILFYSKKYKINYLWLLDRIAIVTPLTATFIRVGNFMNSEIIGKPTNSNYGVIFHRFDNIPRHPAQLYEAFSYLLIFIILFVVYKKGRKQNDGYIFGLFMILLFTTRFLIEFLKINQVMFENNLFINMGQLLSIPFILIGVFLLKKTSIIKNI